MVAAAGVVIAACAPAHDCQGCTVPQQFDVHITEKDHAVDVHTGQKIELFLHANPGMSRPASTSMTLLCSAPSRFM